MCEGITIVTTPDGESERRKTRVQGRKESWVGVFFLIFLKILEFRRAFHNSTTKLFPFLFHPPLDTRRLSSFRRRATPHGLFSEPIDTPFGARTTEKTPERTENGSNVLPSRPPCRSSAWSVFPRPAATAAALRHPAPHGARCARCRGSWFRCEKKKTRGRSRTKMEEKKKKLGDEVSPFFL